jgi:hypothetical protein
MVPIKILVCDDILLFRYLARMGYDVALLADTTNKTFWKAFGNLFKISKTLNQGEYDVVVNGDYVTVSIARLFSRKAKHIAYNSNWIVSSLSDISVTSKDHLDVLRAIETC